MPVASLGPALATVRVNTTFVPTRGVALSTLLTSDRSERAAGVSVSVAVLLAAAGSVIPAGAVTEAVLTRFPVAPGRTFAVIV